MVNTMAKKRSALVTTGGTIASKVDPSTGLAMSVLGGEALLESLQLMQRPINMDVEIHEVTNVSSLYISSEHWVSLHNTIQDLLKREDIEAVIVSHGTAVLEETAWFLDLTIRSDKPVIVIGAQRNTSDYDTDGPRNLYNALLLAEHPDARGKGVLVTLNNHINAAREVTKSHTVDVETFQSGEWGYLGSIVNTTVRFHRAPLRRLHVPLKPEMALPKVDIACMYAGADGGLLEAAVDLGAVGMVVQAVASGHVNKELFQAVERVLAKGVPVVIATRIPRGGTRPGYGFEGSSQRLIEAGAVLSGDLSAWKARILLMLALQNNQADRQSLTRLFD